ncbi:MAG: hypothetical protein D6743_19125 [Calditrichaeota bacterium]|nr:MAG: hypothetical protein D6743_19125 [Calditrichota bacterium]
MKSLTLFSFLAVFLAICSVDQAVAGCGAATCPLNTHRYLRSGRLTFGFAREYINQDQIHVGSSASFVGAFRQPGQEHDEVQTINSRDIVRMQYGVFSRLALSLEVPFVHREHSHFVIDEAKWESWNFTGLGDVILSGQFAALLPPSEFSPYLSFALGVKLATGVTNARNGEGEKAEVTIQPGTGSTDVILGVDYRQALASVPTLSGGVYATLPVSIGVTYRINGAGTLGWRFGNELIASLGTEYQLANRATLLFQINGRFQEKADPGRVDIGDVPPGNTGGTWIYASPGLRVQLSDSFSAYGIAQLPVYQDVNGIQQTSNLNLQFGVSFETGLLE